MHLRVTSGPLFGGQDRLGDLSYSPTHPTKSLPPPTACPPLARPPWSPPDSHLPLTSIDPNCAPARAEKSSEAMVAEHFSRSVRSSSVGPSMA